MVPLIGSFNTKVPASSWRMTAWQTQVFFALRVNYSNVTKRMSASEVLTGVRLRRGTSIPNTRTALVGIQTPGAGLVGEEHGLGMTESRQTGDRLLIRQTL